MGVTATGKSAVGTRLADRLDMAYLEGDEFHPEANIQKMSDGEPLTDDDRRPWLEALALKLAQNRDAGVATVLGCSALRRSYRDILRGPYRPETVSFVHLTAPFDVLRDRMEQREHFMPASLLQSQFDTLEPPEEAIRIDVAEPLERSVEKIRAALQT